MSLDISFKRDIEQKKDEHRDNSYSSKKQKLKNLAKEIIMSAPNLEEEILIILSSRLDMDRQIELLEKYKGFATKNDPNIDELIMRIDTKLEVLNNVGRRSR